MMESPGSPSSVLLTDVADELARSVCACIWSAASNLNAVDNDDDGKRRRALVKATQSRLLSAHPDLIICEIAKTKRVPDKPVSKRKHARTWRPTRPRLALAAAELMRGGSAVVQAPAEKLEDCRLPFKIFAKSVAQQLRTTSDVSDSYSSVVHAVKEVVSAVFAEAVGLSPSDEGGVGLELHGSAEASWRGTSARGAGIAMDESGRSVVTMAAGNVASRLKRMSAAV